MLDLPERLEKWAEDPTVFLSHREMDLLFEAAGVLRTLSAEVEALRLERAEKISLASRSIAGACSAARLAGRADALQESAAACDDIAQEYRRRAASSVPGMSFEREWGICADAAHMCAELVRRLSANSLADAD